MGIFTGSTENALFQSFLLPRLGKGSAPMEGGFITLRAMIPDRRPNLPAGLRRESELPAPRSYTIEAARRAKGFAEGIL